MEANNKQSLNFSETQLLADPTAAALLTKLLDKLKLDPSDFPTLSSLSPAAVAILCRMKAARQKIPYPQVYSLSCSSELVEKVDYWLPQTRAQLGADEAVRKFSTILVPGHFHRSVPLENGICLRIAAKSLNRIAEREINCAIELICSIPTSSEQLEELFKQTHQIENQLGAKLQRIEFHPYSQNTESTYRQKLLSSSAIIAGLSAVYLCSQQNNTFELSTPAATFGEKFAHTLFLFGSRSLGYGAADNYTANELGIPSDQKLKELAKSHQFHAGVR